MDDPVTAGAAAPLLQPLGEVCRRPAIAIAATATVGEAARLLRREGVGALLVAAEPPGIVTDRDLTRRVLAEGKGPETPVAEVMSRPVHQLDAAATLLDAQLVMAERRLRHVPVTEGGEVVGVVSASDLLRLQANDPLSLSRRVEEGRLPPGGYATEASQLVRHLRASGVEAPRIGLAMAALADGLVRRLLRQAESELGPPPRPYAFLVYGSEGRREQLLPTDQDNALVWAEGAAGEDDGAVEGYFAAFAARVVEGLIAAGLPECPGGYMATRWRFSLTAAEATLRAFLERPRAETVLDACTLFDFRVAGGELAIEPLARLRSEAREARHFLRLLAADAAGFKLPLGWLGRLREGEGGFDLKRGILLIVAVARLFALAAGSPAVGTLDRLEAAEATLGESDARTLAEAFRFLVGLRLDEQLAGHGRGSKVKLAALNAMEHQFLEDVFAFLHDLQNALPQRFAL